MGSGDGVVETKETSDSNSNTTPPPPPPPITTTTIPTKPYYSLGVKSHQERSISRQPDEHGQTPPTQPKSLTDTHDTDNDNDDDDLDEQCVTVPIEDSDGTNVTTNTSI